MANLHCEAIAFPSSDGKHTSLRIPLHCTRSACAGCPSSSATACANMCAAMHRWPSSTLPTALHWRATTTLATVTPPRQGARATTVSQNGRCHLLNDLHTMNRILYERFPDTPIILYGPQHGQLYAVVRREVAGKPSRRWSFPATAGPSFMNVVGQRLAGLIARVKGPRYVSPLMVKLNFGSYCRKIENAQSPNAWLSRDKSVVKAYDADGLSPSGLPLRPTARCSRRSTTSAQRHGRRLFDKDLPVLLIAGDCDPVGNYGSGVRKVWAMLGDAGVRDLTCQIFEGGRHELHNETNRDEVFDYVLTWIEDHIS